MKVGSIQINNWPQWFGFLTVLILFQTIHVYMEESYGRPFDRQHIQEKNGQNKILYGSLYIIFINGSILFYIY